MTVRRYRLAEELPAALLRTATMALRRDAHKPVQDDKGERESFGWVNPRDLLDSELVWEDMVDGNLAYLAARLDRKTFNRQLFRARLERRFAEVREEKGVSRLTRQHRLALQEELTIQMLKEVTPSIAFTELVWDLNTGQVYVGATSRATCERICDLFTKTFDLRLQPLFPALVGYAMMTEQGLEENFDAASAKAVDATPASGQPTADTPAEPGGE